MPDIMHLLSIKASPEQVYQAITTTEGIRSWWTRDAVLDAHVGGIGEFGFRSEQRAVTRVKVTELTPLVRVGWTTIASFRPEWNGTTITFELRAKQGITAILFAQRGFVNADEGYALTTTGWGYYLVSLQQYLETGKGAPSPDIDFARVIR